MKGFIAKTIITPTEVIHDGVILYEDGKILSVGRKANVSIPDGTPVEEYGDKVLVPGFIDIHAHGALGNWAQESPEAVLKMAKYIAKHGTTSFLPTVMHLEGVKSVVAAREIQEAEGYDGADIAGIHMEGPFLAPKNLPGAGFVDERLKPPSVQYVRECHEASRGLLKIMGLAIELDGAFEVVKELRRLGVVPAIAHTRASYEDFLRGVEAGIRHATHIFNVMTGMHHRRPGVVGGILTNDQVTAELIGDGFHVHPAAMDVVIRCKGPDKVALITDLTEIAGLPDGEYGNIVLKDGVARLKGFTEERDNTMAGSMWPITRGIRNVVRLGYPLQTAVKMATLTPARIAEIDEFKGSLEPGKDADIVVIDEDVNVYLTVVKGTTVYRSSIDL